ncbi:MAG: four helix bundle protein [Candidatus Omnitrophota bacterium]|nr:MAG: four helix bundle protein [Candidatus Omnitrophota bacterium]
MEAIKDFKDLRIWQKGIEIVNKVYRITQSFPKEELYGIVSQMRRSAVSIPSNIAEGFIRRSNREYKQFLYIALGSCAELETQFIIAKDNSFLNDKDKDEIIQELNYESRMLMTMIKKL